MKKMSNLDYASLRGANFTNANAVGISAHCADFTGAIMIGANFTRADMRGAILDNVTIDKNTHFGNLAGSSIQGMRELGADGSYKPVTYERLQELGAKGIGLNVAAERAQCMGNVYSDIRHTPDSPNQAPESVKDFMESLKNYNSQHASAADLGSLKANVPDTRTPAEQGTSRA
jgi:uncharacterized protein YjbI with pentapeptide repeats